MSLAGQCTTGPGRRGFPGGYNPAPRYQNRWWTLCTFTAPAAGVYPLQVRVADLADDPATGVTACGADCLTTTGGTGDTNVTAGLNAYAIRATAAGGPAPRTFALGEMSIYRYTPSETSTQLIIEVPAERAGDRVVVDLFDPGDLAGTAPSIELNGPSGLDVSCTLAYGTTTGARTAPPEGTESYPTQCRAPTKAAGSTRFDGRWVRLTATVPAGYTCTSDCWWTLTWDNPGSSTTDRLTIAASITEPT